MSGDSRVPVVIILFLLPWSIHHPTHAHVPALFPVAYFQGSKGLAFCFCLEPHLSQITESEQFGGSCVKGQNILEATRSW